MKPSDTGAWRALLEGEQATRALGVAEEIACALEHAPPGTLEPSEAAELALLHHALGRPEQAEARLNEALDRLSAAKLGPALYDGWLGIAWIAEHLSPGASEDVDGLVGRVLDRADWAGRFDLVSGLTGLGVYALERAADAPALLSRVLTLLEGCAERQEQGLTWFTPAALLPEHQRRECPAGHYNLGVAHGVPGVVSFLGSALAAGCVTARPLLKESVRWLLAQRLPEGLGARFPHWIGSKIMPQPGRSAWCYGDPGVAAALLHAGRCAGESAWEVEALALAHGVVGRPRAAAAVSGPGLCHGAAGLAHLFNRMAQRAGDGALSAEARRWFGQLLDERQLEVGIAGFDTERRVKGRPDPGLLVGAVGVGLALVAAASDEAPSWDRLLLLS
jgi:hypothetical protein